MLRDDAANYTGNDRFIGYCVDLTKRLAEIVNFTYEFSLVKDNNFGARGIFNEFFVNRFSNLNNEPFFLNKNNPRCKWSMEWNCWRISKT